MLQGLLLVTESAFVHCSELEVKFTLWRLSLG